MGFAEKNTAKTEVKRREIYSFSIDVGTKNSLEKIMQRMNKIKDVWEPEHHIIAEKLHNVNTVKSADGYDNVKDLHRNEVLDTKEKVHNVIDICRETGSKEKIKTFEITEI